MAAQQDSNLTTQEILTGYLRPIKPVAPAYHDAAQGLRVSISRILCTFAIAIGDQNFNQTTLVRES